MKSDLIGMILRLLKEIEENDAQSAVGIPYVLAYNEAHRMLKKMGLRRRKKITQ